MSVPIAGGAGGFVKARELHKRRVNGYVAALVSVSDPSQVNQLGALPGLAGTGISEAALPEVLKARYDAAKITVEAQNGEWWFRDGNGKVTENEFVHRYADATSSHELDTANRVRNRGALLGALSLTVAGAAGIVGAALINTNCKPPDARIYTDPYSEPEKDGYCPRQGGSNEVSREVVPGATTSPQFYNPDASNGNTAYQIMFGSLGGMAAAGGIAWGIFSLTQTEGASTDHTLSEADGRLYAEVYNRRVLRKMMRETDARLREVSHAAPALRVEPVISLGFVGIRGSF